MPETLSGNPIGKFYTDETGSRVMNPKGFFNIDKIQFEGSHERPSKVTFTMDYDDALDLVHSAKRCKVYDEKRKSKIKDEIIDLIGIDSLKTCFKTFLKISRMNPSISQFDFADQETLSDDEDEKGNSTIFSNLYPRAICWCSKKSSRRKYTVNYHYPNSL